MGGGISFDIKSFLNQTLELLFPSHLPCPFCGSAADQMGQVTKWARVGLCQQCAKKIDDSMAGTVECVKCGKFIQKKKSEKKIPEKCKSNKIKNKDFNLDKAIKCHDCTHDEPGFIRGWAVGPYENELKEAIYRLKYGRERSLAKALGRMMAERLWSKLHGENSSNIHLFSRFLKHYKISPLLVPIPLHADKLYERGFNQSELLAIEIARETGFKALGDLLFRKENTVKQAGLSKAHRERNIKETFDLNPSLVKDLSKNVRCNNEGSLMIVLIDDVYTTGATMKEAVRAVSESIELKPMIYSLTVCAGRQQTDFF